MPRRRSGPCSSSPASQTEPEFCRSRPPTMRINVVLPQPDGPRNMMSSPSSALSDNSLTTGVSTVPSSDQ